MSIFGKIFGGLIWIFALIFKGRTGKVIDNISSIVVAVVASLLNSDLSGPERFKEAFKRIKNAALAAGLETADHAIEVAIEFEVTEAHGDPLEQILDEGLGIARETVQTVARESEGMDDETRFSLAFDRLKEELLSRGKEWLTKDRTINLLVRAAVASFKE